MRDVWQDARKFRHCRKASSGRDARWWGNHTCTMASRSIYTDGTHGVGAGNGVKGGGSLLSRSLLLFTLSTVRYRARRPRCGNQQLESRVRENRQHGSEGGEAKAFPTPITTLKDLILNDARALRVRGRLDEPASVGKYFSHAVEIRVAQTSLARGCAMGCAEAGRARLEWEICRTKGTPDLKCDENRRARMCLASAPTPSRSFRI
jgi:hypothetical protein